MTGTTASQTSIATTPFLPPALKPVTMDIDATHTCKEFMCWMCEWCFGYGSTIHSKREGNYEWDLYAYCKCVRHWEIVYMNKFMGRPKGQKPVVTIGEVRTGVNTLSTISEEADKKEITAMTTGTLTQLMQQQKMLADQIMALHKMDFWSRHAHKLL